MRAGKMAAGSAEQWADRRADMKADMKVDMMVDLKAEPMADQKAGSMAVPLVSHLDFVKVEKKAEQTAVQWGI